jgi:carbon catabolite-derepressing protein kinase
MQRSKIIEKNLGLNIKQEVQFMLELRDKEFIMPLEQLITREKELVMVFPYFPGRDLYRYMRAHKNPKGHLTEYEAWVVTKQLIAALKTCHSHNILHRDIKPENIMLDDELNIALSDFGLAIRLNGQNTGRAGTPCYYPYEMVAG